MNVDCCWENYSKNSRKLSTLLRIYALSYVVFLGLNLGIKVFVFLDILQYFYMTIYYETKGNIIEYENLKELHHTFWDVLPMSIIFYIKVLVMLGVVISMLVQ